MPQNVDLLVLHAHLLTMQGDGVGYVRDGAVAVRGDSIVDVGPSAELSRRYQADETLDASGCAVLPGLVDVHMHTVYAVVRGVAQDVANWMQKGLAPFSRHMNDAAARAGTRLNIIEAMQAGTTTLGDFVRPYPGWGECFAEAGVRACLTPTINALPPGGMAGWQLGELYPQFLADFREIGAEWVIQTPHYSRPDWMKLASELHCVLIVDVIEKDRKFVPAHTRVKSLRQFERFQSTGDVFEQ